MLRGARGRRADARVARVAAFAVSVLTALPVTSSAGDVVVNNARAGAGTGTMNGALVQAYQNNPTLNAQRSATRATDENVPTALSGYRPRVSGTSSLTDQYLDTLTKAGTTPGGPRSTTSKKAPSRCRPSA